MVQLGTRWFYEKISKKCGIKLFHTTLRFLDNRVWKLAKYRLNLDGGYYICKNKSKLWNKIFLVNPSFSRI